MVPEHKSPEKDDDSPKRIGKQSTSEPSEASPLTPQEALTCFAAIETQRPKEARATYARIRRCAENRWEELFTMYRSMDPKEVALPHQWGMLELAYVVSKPRKASGSRREAVAATVPLKLAECAAALHTSIHLSSANLATDIEKGLETRLSPGETKTSLRPWERGINGQAEDLGCWLSGPPPEGVAAFSHAGARLALEWKVRSDLLAFPLLDREATYEHLKQHRHGLEALGRLIVAAVKEERRQEDVRDISIWRIAQEIVESIGRQPEVWGAIDKQRLELIRVQPSDDWQREKWAWMVASTWAATDKSKEAVRRLAPAELEPLVATSGQLQVRGLQRISAEALGNSVAQEIADVGAGHETRTVPETRSKESGSTDQAGIARFRLSPPDVQARQLFQAVRLGDPLKLLASWPWPGLEELDQRSVIPALTEFIATAEHALRDRAHAQAQEAQKLLFETAASWENALASLSAALGTDVPRLSEALTAARSTIVNGGVAVSPDYGDTNAHERIDFTPQRADNALDRLRKLAGLALRDPVKAQQERSSLRRHIAWAIGDQADIQQLMDAVPELPEEALAQVWTAGVGMNSGLLMGTVIPFLEQREGWAERMWTAILRSLAATHHSSLAAPPMLASLSVSLLSARLDQLRTELLAPDSETPLAAAKRRIIKARSTLLAIVELIVRDIGDFKSVIEGLNDGTSDRG